MRGMDMKCKARWGHLALLAAALFVRMASATECGDGFCPLPSGAFATVKITLPKAWDGLMAERGYRPLADFMLSSEMEPDPPKPKSRRMPPRTGAHGDRPNGQRT